MLDIDDNILEIKKYLKKITTTITSESVFSFGDTRILKKNRVDDLLCCIEAVIPQEYKNLTQSANKKKFQSVQNWNDLNAALKNKFILSSDHYIIKYSEVISRIQDFQKTYGNITVSIPWKTHIIFIYDKQTLRKE